MGIAIGQLLSARDPEQTAGLSRSEYKTAFPAARWRKHHS
jgi:hypothetical protein